MSTTPMASAILTSPCSSSPVRKPTIFCTFSSCLSSNLRNPDLHSFKLIPQTQFCSWSGLKQHGLSVPTKSFKLERRRRCRGKVVFASLFGVGAPEALVIGVVALLVFGPKGLAEVARNLGKTLRAFQPTIRELQEVSREFKSTLEKEIGLDEIQNSVQSSFNSTTINSTSPSSSVYTSEDSQTVVDPNDAASPSKAYSTEDYLKVTEEQLKASAALQQKEESTSSLAETPSEPQTHTQGSIQEVAATTAAEQSTSSPAETPLESQVQSQDSVQEVSAITSAEQPKIET